MPRVFGVLAIFGGWLSILAGAVFGLIATQFLDLDHIEGALPPSGVYGVPSVAVLWIAVGTAVITAVPAGAAMFARDPSRRLYVAAAVMAGVGVVLLPDDLGRAYAAALIPGAMLLAAGGWWTHKAGEIGEALAPAGFAAVPAIGAEPAALAPVGFAAAPAIGAEPAALAPAAGPAPSLTVAAPVAPFAAPVAAVPSGIEPTASAAAPGTRPTTRSARGSAKSQKPADAECPWCSARIPAGAERCPSCGAVLTEGVELSAVRIPGVTDVAPELRAYSDRVERQKTRVGLLSMILGDPDDRLFTSPGGRVDPGVLGPPSADIRAEMERFDREIAAGKDAGTAAAPDVAAGEAEADPPADSRPASNA